MLLVGAHVHHASWLVGWLGRAGTRAAIGHGSAVHGITGYTADPIE